MSFSRIYSLASYSYVQMSICVTRANLIQIPLGWIIKKQKFSCTSFRKNCTSQDELFHQKLVANTSCTKLSLRWQHWNKHTCRNDYVNVWKTNIVFDSDCYSVKIDTVIDCCFCCFTHSYSSSMQIIRERLKSHCGYQLSLVDTPRCMNSNSIWLWWLLPKKIASDKRKLRLPILLLFLTNKTEKLA